MYVPPYTVGPPSLRRADARQPKETAMNFLGARAAARPLNAAGIMRRYLPTAAALLYPLAPLALYESGRQFALASNTTDKLATLTTWLVVATFVLEATTLGLLLATAVKK